MSSTADTVTDGADVPPDDADASPDAPPTKRRRLLEWILVLVVAAVCSLLVREFVVAQFKVRGSSMVSTLHDGDRVLVNKLSYKFHDPRRGDVVVLEPIHGGTDSDLIKRVVGLPGETVEFTRDCKLVVNGTVIPEPYLDQVARTSCGAAMPAQVVQARHVLVMGDNRGNSMDSRDTEKVGQVPWDKIVGRAFVVVWPISHWAWL